MTCQRVIDEFLMAYLDGELPFRQRLSFNLHLALCRHCRRYLDSYRKTVALTKSAVAEIDQPVSPDVPEALVKAILAARRIEK